MKNNGPHVDSSMRTANPSAARRPRGMLAAYLAWVVAAATPAWARDVHAQPDRAERPAVRTGREQQAATPVTIVIDGKKLTFANHGVDMADRVWRFDGLSRLDLDRTLAPDVAGRRAIRIAGAFSSEARDGVLIAHGGNRYGLAVYLKDGALVFTQVTDWKRTLVSSDVLTDGEHAFVAERDPHGKLTLHVDGKAVGSAIGPILEQNPGDSLQLGADTIQPVGDYAVPNAFHGTIRGLTVNY